VSRSELDRHRRIWARKPALPDVYGVWFDALLECAPHGAAVLETGAGPGFFAAHARGRRPDLLWVASDVVETPWNDVVADALRLPLRDASVHALLSLDLLHHLARPAAFFAEAARVLKPGGCVGSVEPWVTPLSYPIYRWTHPEGCSLGLDPWDPFGAASSADKDPFRGDNAAAWLLVRRTPRQRWRELGFLPPRLALLNGFAYLATLGFREASPAPPWAVRGLKRVDRALGWSSPCLGLRAVLVWERAAATG
jgi:SAM-dependent methyltransferase